MKNKNKDKWKGINLHLLHPEMDCPNLKQSKDDIIRLEHLIRKQPMETEYRLPLNRTKIDQIQQNQIEKKIYDSESNSNRDTV